MSHRFDRSKLDPYSVAATQIEAHMFSGAGDYQRGAEGEIYSSLSTAVVAALGDIAASAYRLGINDPRQIKGLAKAIANSCEAAIQSYRGEIDPEPALQAIEADMRGASFATEDQEELKREIDKTRQLEHLLLTARRLPELIDFAGSLGLHIEEDWMEEGTLLVGDHPTPNAEMQAGS